MKMLKTLLTIPIMMPMAKARCMNPAESSERRESGVIGMMNQLHGVIVDL